MDPGHPANDSTFPGWRGTVHEIKALLSPSPTLGAAVRLSLPFADGNRKGKGRGVRGSHGVLGLPFLLSRTLEKVLRED